jgi:hypothetical protein
MTELLQNRGNPLNVSNGSLKTTVSITRAATAPTYLSGYVVGATGSNFLTFSNISNVSNGSVFITSANIEIDTSTLPSGIGTFRLHLYDTAPTAVADNTAFDLIAGDRSKYLGFIEIATPSKLGSTLWGETNGIMKQIKFTNNSTTLYCILTTNGSYLAVSGDVYKVGISTIGA